MSNISWTMHTINSFVGCSNKSEGCQHCYVPSKIPFLVSCGFKHYEGITKPGKDGKQKWTGIINRAEGDPFKCVRKEGKKKNSNAFFFVNSMSDFFHEQALDSWRLEILDIAKQYPQLYFQILTKRPENIKPFLERTGVEFGKNIYLGTTVENRKAISRIKLLTDIPAAIRFLSIEPLLEDLGELPLGNINWVIVGGESTSKGRFIHPNWARRIRRQCKAADVPFFFKQWGQVKNNPLAQFKPPGITLNRWVTAQEVSALRRAGIRCKQCLKNNRKERCKKCDKVEKGGSLLDGQFYKAFPLLGS
jgi:protein gp37